MVNSRLVIISYVPFRPHSAAWPSVNTDRARDPIHSNGHNMSIRYAVARRCGGTERLVKRQLTELIAREAMPCPPKEAVHCHAGKPLVVELGIAGYAVTRRLGRANSLQAFIVRISEIQRHGPYTRQGVLYIEASQISLRAGEQSAAVGLKSFVSQIEVVPGQFVAQTGLSRHANPGAGNGPFQTQTNDR